jgi:hypothetical protein
MHGRVKDSEGSIDINIKEIADPVWKDKENIPDRTCFFSQPKK